MDSGSAAASRAKTVGLTPLGRRHHYRHQIQGLAYVNLDQTNGGIIRNLGDRGLAIQAVAPLRVGQQVFLRFDLTNPRVRLEATGRVAWADPVGQAGVEFLALPQRSRRLLKEWIFIQLLSSAQHSSGDSSFLYGASNVQPVELVSSAAARPAIPLEPESHLTLPRKESETASDAVLFSWLPFAISAAALSRLVDGLILLSAILLFAVICIAMIGDVPEWPVALGAGLGATAVFALLYRYLFLFWIGGTPGDLLAGITDGLFDGSEIRAEEMPRFR